MRFQKQQKKQFAILEKRKKDKEKMIEKEKKEHNGGDCLKTHSSQNVS